MSKLRYKFSNKEWQDCCGKFCEDCKLANTYRKKFGKKEGKKILTRTKKEFQKSIKGTV